MNVRKTIASTVAVLLVAGGFAMGVAAPASATQTDTVCIPSDAIPAYTEVVADIEHPAVGEPTITIDNPDFVPAVVEVSHVEVEFAFKKDHPNSPRWELEGWNADSNPNSEGWHATGLTRVVIDVPGSDAVGEPTIVVDNPDYVAAYTEVVPDIEHAEVPAVTCPEEPVVVAPQACVSAGAAYTEGDDLAPVATPSGLLFEGGTGQAVGIRWPVTGNLQGWAPVSFVNTGGQSEFFFRVVIDASADGGPAYKSLSFPGYSTVDSASISYQYGESIAATAERFPNAVITSVGFQTNSGAVEGYSATLQSVTGSCTSANFVWAPLPEDTAELGSPEFTVDCDTEVGDVVTATVAWTATNYSYDEQGNIVAASSTGTTEEDYTITQNDIDAAELDCETPVTPVDPEEPVTPTEPEEPTTPDWGNKAARVATAGELAATGTPAEQAGVLTLLAALAAGVIAAGGGALWLRRRQVANVTTEPTE